MEKQWKVFATDCPVCGSEIEVFTNAPEDLFYDGDEARCSDGCGFLSSISVSDGVAELQDGNENELDKQCRFPNCGCPEARLCMAKRGAKYSISRNFLG